VNFRQVLIDEGANEKLLTMAWIANHYKWIVWKLCCMERSFPTYFSNYLSLERVLSQLRYRYEREINRAHRSALKKILEKDESSTKYMILVVSAIKSYGDDDYLSSLSEDSNPKVTLTIHHDSSNEQEEKQEDVTTVPKPEGVIELSDGYLWVKNCGYSGLKLLVLNNQ
jgi:breast cancer 2 susceptibility protein